ncbi:MAG: 23S rRNA methyltransferase [Thermoleophilaceae bacterium]|nr:23S rRNA methyltransferase [Thermoleophilaceae bacterium]
MLEHVIDMLACPHCGDPLALRERSLRCRRGHAFDVARQGYVTLLPGEARPGGDTSEMVEARAAFLAAGHYRPLVDAVAATAERFLADGPSGGVVELGAGTGQQLAQVLERAPGRAGLALDLSRAAARRAARAHPRIGAVVCDVWRRLPVRSGAAALVLDVFAPRNGPEIRRVLHPRGALVVASAAPRHLAELVERLGLLRVDERKPERIEQALGAGLERVERRVREFELELTRTDAERLVAMGPSAWHTEPSALRERLADLPEPVRVGASVVVSAYRPV